MSEADLMDKLSEELRHENISVQIRKLDTKTGNVFIGAKSYSDWILARAALQKRNLIAVQAAALDAV
jgi:hypothetical protein